MKVKEKFEILGPSGELLGWGMHTRHEVGNLVFFEGSGTFSFENLKE